MNLKNKTSANVEILQTEDNAKAHVGESGDVMPADGLLATFRLSQVSLALQLNDRTVRNLVARGLLKPIPGIRHLRFTAREVNRFINNGK